MSHHSEWRTHGQKRSIHLQTRRFQTKAESHTQRSEGQKPIAQFWLHQSSVALGSMAWQLPGVGVGVGTGVGGGGGGVGVGAGPQAVKEGYLSHKDFLIASYCGTPGESPILTNGGAPTSLVASKVSKSNT